MPPFPFLDIVWLHEASGEEPGCLKSGGGDVQTEDVLAETQTVVVKHLAFLFMQTLQFQTRDQVDLQVIRLLHVEIGATADGFNVRQALLEQFRRLDLYQGAWSPWAGPSAEGTAIP